MFSQHTSMDGLHTCSCKSFAVIGLSRGQDGDILPACWNLVNIPQTCPHAWLIMHILRTPVLRTLTSWSSIPTIRAWPTLTSRCSKNCFTIGKSLGCAFFYSYVWFLGIKNKFISNLADLNQT